jgi:hypothetical protein
VPRSENPDYLADGERDKRPSARRWRRPSNLLPSRRRPEPERPVHAGAGEGSLIGGKGEGGDETKVPAQSGGLVSGGHIPKLNRPIHRADGDSFSVPGKAKRGASSSACLEGGDLAEGRNIPQKH